MENHIHHELDDGELDAAMLVSLGETMNRRDLSAAQIAKFEKT